MSDFYVRGLAREVIVAHVVAATPKHYHKYAKEPCRAYGAYLRGMIRMISAQEDAPLLLDAIGTWDRTLGEAGS